MINQQKFYFFILLFAGIFISSCEKSDPIPDFTSANTGPYIYNMDHLYQIKHSGDKFILREKEQLIYIAGLFLQQHEYLFVTDKGTPPPSGNQNDYMSLHRYVVPNEQGTYILGDREVNAEIYEYDRAKLALLSEAVHTLSLAFFYTDEEKYAAKAAGLLRAWFFDEATKMNPNLNYAQINLSQFDLNHTDVRGGPQGIVDTNDLVLVLEAVSLLYDSPSWTPDDHTNLKKWFYEFTQWIQGKNNILGSLSPDLHCVEGYCNNVATWADLQRTVYYLFTEQENLINSGRHIQPISTKLYRQLTTEGRQKYEESRNRSQHYYYYNLKALVHLMTVRKNRTGYDRDWEHLSQNELELTGLKAALNKLSDFIETGDPGVYFRVDPAFNNCRYLEIFRPAALLFENEEYSQTAQLLIEAGCSNTNITLTFPAYHAAAGS